MIEPIDSLVYLYYKCSSCGEVGDSIRLAETQQRLGGVYNHVCPFCNHVDPVRPIRNMKIEYHKMFSDPNAGRGKTTSTKIVHTVDDRRTYDKTKKLLKKYGYSPTQIKDGLDSVLTSMPHSDEDLTAEALFKLVVLELDEQTTTK